LHQALGGIVRILALEVERPGATAEEFAPLLEREARAAWGLVQEDVIREIYFRADRDCAVLMLECDDLEQAESKLSELPVVAAGLIQFELIPLKPYPGFARLFAD
jgi:hypothetical protein